MNSAAGPTKAVQPVGNALALERIVRCGTDLKRGNLPHAKESRSVTDEHQPVGREHSSFGLDSPPEVASSIALGTSHPATVFVDLICKRHESSVIPGYWADRVSANPFSFYGTGALRSPRPRERIGMPRCAAACGALASLTGVCNGASVVTNPDVRL
jgi:hypothetical protein